jgi:hypothetical protein
MYNSARRIGDDGDSMAEIGELCFTHGETIC